MTGVLAQGSSESGIMHISIFVVERQMVDQLSQGSSERQFNNGDRGKVELFISTFLLFGDTRLTYCPDEAGNGSSIMEIEGKWRYPL